MKAGKEHHVPLSKQVMALLLQLPRDGAFVFPGRSKESILSDVSLTGVLRRMGRGDITVHGFRSTFRHWCAEAVGNAFSREVCEHARAHSLPSKVGAAYRRGDLFDQRVPLMLAWADYCAKEAVGRDRTGLRRRGATAQGRRGAASGRRDGARRSAHLAGGRTGKDCPVMAKRRLDAAARLDADYPHPQTATGPGRSPQGGPERVGGKRMAVHESVGGIRPAGGAYRHSFLWQPESARRRALRPPATPVGLLDHAPAAGRLCQALGVPPHLKYESDGGPGLADLAAVLRGSERAQEDLTTLLTRQVLFWLLAAPDGHAKNFSIRLLAGGRYQPLYDVMSIWPIEGGGANQYALHKARLAMALLGKNKHYRFADAQRRHFNSTAARWFLRTDAEDVIERVLARTDGAIEAVAARLPAGFPQRVADAIFAGIVRHTKLLDGMPKK
uniref:HipA-like C-terminal domain-containing protein n=1 Tax=Tanacetum cinerariifolium TaxID=118510 RepID=A0A699GEX0_TANCI|nr:hypothetical protein [Tanacetum cinerariifolium]